MGEDLELLNFYRDEIRFGSGMLSSRFNALIASRSFLAIGYASSMSASPGRWHDAFSLVFPPSLALLGLVLALYAWPGTEAAHDVIRRWHAKEGELLARNAGLAARYRLAAPAGGVSAKERLRRGTMFAKYAHYVFAVAWLCFGAMPVVFYLRS